MVFWRQNAILCSICRRTPAHYNSMYRFPQNLECLAVWEEKLLFSKFYTAMGAVLLHVCAIFRLENTQ